MTEDEAKTKPCIGPRPYNTGIPQPRDADYQVIYHCSASACMAWRRRRWFWWPAMTLGEQWRREEIGHCGLAGKP